MTYNDTICMFMLIRQVQVAWMTWTASPTRPLPIYTHSTHTRTATTPSAEGVDRPTVRSDGAALDQHAGLLLKSLEFLNFRKELRQFPG